MYRNFVKFGHAVFETSQQTDRPTNRHTDIRYADRNTFFTYRGRNNNTLHYLLGVTVSRVLETFFVVRSVDD